MTNKRIVALDVGVKTIGLALTDALWFFPSPFLTIKRGISIEKDFEQLNLSLADFEIVAFVLGWPVTASGLEGKMVDMVRGFEKRLKKKYPQTPVFREDERFTTKEAIEITLRKTRNIKKEKKNGNLDAKAAALILGSFMKTKDFFDLKNKYNL